MVRLAIVTKSASTKSGARAPLELALHLQKLCDVTIFAQNGHVQKNQRLIFYKNSFDLYRSLKTGGFDIISFHSTLVPLIATRLTSIPIVRTYYGTQFDAYLERFLPNQKINFFHKSINSLINLLLWINQKIMLVLSNQIIAISQAAQKELKKLYGKNSTVIYLGSNLKPKTNREPSTARLASLAKRVTRQLTILSVSRITPYKGFHKLIEAVDDVRAKTRLDIKLIIAGSLGKANYLKYLQSNLNTSDQIITNPTDKTLSRLYSQCNIYATCDRFLFFGLPVLEAAQFAKPTVTLNYQAAGELVIHSQTGFVAKSPEEFKKCIEILITNRKLSRKFGLAAQKFAQKNFNFEKIATTYQKIFKKLVNR